MLSTDQFSWNSDKSQLSAEASDLKGFEPYPLYPDACDVGFHLKSARSGDVVMMVETGCMLDDDGDTAYWIYEPVNYNGRAFTLIIFND